MSRATRFFSAAVARRWVGIAMGLGAALWQTADARAMELWFGTGERIREIQPTKDPQYKLCYKVSIFFFIAGCYVKDDGYVLQMAGEPSRYIALTPEMIRQLQQDGTLPTPLPPYSLWWLDYLAGYSTWIILGPIIGFPLAKSAWVKMRGRPAQDPQPKIPQPKIPPPKRLLRKSRTVLGLDGVDFEHGFQRWFWGRAR
jgi:hypothetical protein